MARTDETPSTSIGDTGLKYLDAKYVEPTGTLSINDIAEKKTHKNMMIDIASSLSYEEFDEIKRLQIF